MNTSVILCTYNRSSLLYRALESVAASTMPAGVQWEVLVVDNNSSDQTRAVVEEFCRNSPDRFRYLFEGRPGKSYALNTGIAAAQGNELAFMDDDVTVAPTWLQNLTAPLRADQCAGVGGPVFPQWTSAPPRWLSPQGWAVAGPLVYFDRGTQPRVLKESLVGTNMAFQRRVFEQYGSFRLDLGPAPGTEIRNEDSEFARRLLDGGEEFHYEPSAVVYHFIAPERLQQRYFLAWWFDKGRSEIRESWGRGETGWRVRGVPFQYFQRLVRWCFSWQTTIAPRRRFEHKLKVWFNAGLIVESYRSSRARRAQSPVSMAESGDQFKLGTGG
jgi:glycosyltransferase involved in cell wall biosynthesis